MDSSVRKITKIARNAQQFTRLALTHSGVGLAEYEFIHAVRKNPGISQAELAKLLQVDKAAIARRVANLLKKGLIQVFSDEEDKRLKKIYLTDAAKQIKDSKNEMEVVFYEWLFSEFNETEKETFLILLDRLYIKSKKGRKSDFQSLLAQIGKQNESI